MINYLIFIASLIAALAGETADHNPETTGELLMPIKTGETSLFSYGLYSVLSENRIGSNSVPGRDLLLMLRNIGAKSLNMEGVTVEDFSFTDSKGKDIKLYLWNVPRTISYGNSTVIHLVTQYNTNMAPPLNLTFQSKTNSFVQFKLSISGIDPQKLMHRPETAVTTKRK
jgi:hypothetical protein